MHFSLFHYLILWDNITHSAENTKYITDMCHSNDCISTTHGLHITEHVNTSRPFRRLEPWMKLNEINSDYWYLLYPVDNTKKLKYPNCKVYNDDVEYHRLKCKTNESLLHVATDENTKWLMSLPQELTFTNVDLRDQLVDTFHNSIETLNTHRTLVDPEIPNVMVTDTGLDYSHCSFYDVNRPIPPLGGFSNSLHSKVLGIVKGEYGDYIAVNNAHGTSTSSLIAGNACGSFAGGSSPQSKIAFIDMAIGDSQLIIPYHLKSITASLYNTFKTRVHSISWGDPNSGGAYTTTSYLIDEIVTDYPELIVCAAAGNTGPNGLVIAPATAKNVISVGSTGSFSSRGPLLDGRSAPDVIYLGVGMTSAAAVYPQSLFGHTTTTSCTGTSCSTPAFCGYLPGLIQRFQAEYGYNPEFSDISTIIQTLDFPYSSLTGHYHVQSVTLNTEFCLNTNSVASKKIAIAWTDPESTNWASPLVFKYLVFINDVPYTVSKANRQLFVTSQQRLNFTIVSLTSGTQPKVSMHINIFGVTTCTGDGALSAETLSELRVPYTSIQTSGVPHYYNNVHPGIMAYVIILLSVLLIC